LTQFVDTYSTIQGGHSLKFGADFRRETLDVLQPPDPTGLFAFNTIFTSGLTASGTPVANTGSGLASFLLGQVNSFNIDVQGAQLKPRAHIAEFFVQDDWRVNNRLSLGLGLRYTLNFPSTVVQNQGAVFNLKTQQLDFLGQNGFPDTARKLNWTDFGPRASLAYKVTDSFAIRSGYGLVWIEQAGITTPFTNPQFPFVQTVTQRTLDSINPAFVLASGPSVVPIPVTSDAGLGQGVFTVDRSLGSGYVQQSLYRSARDHGNGLFIGEFSSWTGADLLDRFAAETHSRTRPHPGVFYSGRLESNEQAYRQCRPALDSQFPLHRA
jgi:hypothetical protein